MFIETNSQYGTGFEINEYKGKTSKYVPVSLTEEMVLNYKALPPKLNNWRRSRIEYGGHAQSCFMEQIIYYPPNANTYVIDLLFDFWQEKVQTKRAKILEEIVVELRRGMKAPAMGTKCRQKVPFADVSEPIQKCIKSADLSSLVQIDYEAP